MFGIGKSLAIQWMDACQPVQRTCVTATCTTIITSILDNIRSRKIFSRGTDARHATFELKTLYPKFVFGHPRASITLCQWDTSFNMMVSRQLPQPAGFPNASVTSPASMRVPSHPVTRGPPMTTVYSIATRSANLRQYKSAAPKSFSSSLSVRHVFTA